MLGRHQRLTTMNILIIYDVLCDIRPNFNATVSRLQMSLKKKRIEYRKRTNHHQMRCTISSSQSCSHCRAIIIILFVIRTEKQTKSSHRRSTQCNIIMMNTEFNHWLLSHLNLLNSCFQHCSCAFLYSIRLQNRLWFIRSLDVCSLWLQECVKLINSHKFNSTTIHKTIMIFIQRTKHTRLKINEPRCRLPIHHLIWIVVDFFGGKFSSD